VRREDDAIVIKCNITQSTIRTAHDERCGTEPTHKFIVAVLKEALKRRGMSTVRAKAELISRLMNDDPSGWMQTIGARAEEMMNLTSGNDDDAYGELSHGNKELQRS